METFEQRRRELVEAGRFERRRREAAKLPYPGGCDVDNGTPHGGPVETFRSCFGDRQGAYHRCIAHLFE